jgi:hypothetical protein
MLSRLRARIEALEKWRALRQAPDDPAQVYNILDSLPADTLRVLIRAAVAARRGRQLTVAEESAREVYFAALRERRCQGGTILTRLPETEYALGAVVFHFSVFLRTNYWCCAAPSELNWMAGPWMIAKRRSYRPMWPPGTRNVGGPGSHRRMPTGAGAPAKSSGRSRPTYKPVRRQPASDALEAGWFSSPQAGRPHRALYASVRRQNINHQKEFL